MDVPHILSIVTHLPGTGSPGDFVYSGHCGEGCQSIAFLGSLVTFVFSLHPLYHFDATRGQMQLEESVR
jgi:hypothetical protein